MSSAPFAPHAAPHAAPQPTARYFHKMLEISTAHLPPELMTHLEDTAGADYPFVSFLNEYGVMLSLPDAEEGPFFLEALGASPLADPRFIAVIDYARALGCTWLLVDRDVTVLPDLPVYEWK